MTQRIIEITSPLFVPEAKLATLDDPRALFLSPQPLVLEIGCGTGHFIAELAGRHPDHNFLAIDIFNKGCLKTCRKLELSGLSNVRVLRMEARYLMTRFLPEESLAAIYINCPDPWPKKRHRDRRLVNADFLELALYYLQPRGDLFFATDVADYAERVAELLAEQPGFVNRQACAIAPRPYPDYPGSKYMQRFLERGQPIYFQHLQRRADARPTLAGPPVVERGFRVRWGRAGNE